MITRRDLARVMGVAATAALLPKAARADDSKKDSKAAPPPPKKLTGAAQLEAEQRVQLVIARYGPRLSKSERADLARISADMQAVLDDLRAFPLDYSDEPAHIFRAPRRR